MFFWRRNKKKGAKVSLKPKARTDHSLKKSFLLKPKRTTPLLPTIAKNIIVTAKKFNKFDQKFYQELKEILIGADFSSAVVLKIMHNLKLKQQHTKTATTIDLLPTIKKTMIDFYGSYENKALHFFNGQKAQDKPLLVVLMVGVNGAGKTTTLAKLGKRWQQQGAKILFVASDTFRAGAVEQLDYWAQTLQADIVKPLKINHDPSSVIYQAMVKANEEGHNMVLIDTGGRLQNKQNLMAQLHKMAKTIDRFLKNPAKQRLTLLTVDAHIGRNALQQTKVFTAITDVNGLVLTKIDGSAKGGIIFTIKDQLKIPVYYHCFGEKLDDLAFFDITSYVNLIFD